MGKDKVKYKYKRDKNVTFVNPYSFVPVKFDDAASRNPESVPTKGLTGKMECRILCKTPIAVPDAAAQSGKELKEGQSPSYEFFKIDGQPVIPGSSVRGVVRNVFETATASCFSTMKPDTRLTRRETRPNLPGILKCDKNGNWILYESERYSIEKKMAKRYQTWNGKMVGFSATGAKKVTSVVTDAESICRKNLKKGILYIGEPIPGKHCESIFWEKGEIVELGDDAERRERIKTAMKGLEVTLACYRNKSVNKEYGEKHDGYPEYERMKERGIIPIWYDYDKQKGRLLFSYAAIGRLAFSKTLNQHVGEKAPCKSRNDLCPACRVFGMIGKEGNGNSLGSRVRFTDAANAEPETPIHLRKYVLAELASPHPSYMPFYSDARFSAYEHRKYPGYDDGSVSIRGRKFYWHSDNFKTINCNVPETGRNARMEVAAAGSVFRFTLYFENLEEKELNQLVWALNFGENDPQGSRMHKLGHGKPIGLGSVKMVVDKIWLREFLPEEGYVVREYEANENAGSPVDMESDSVKALLKICDFNNRQNVRYPFIIGNGEKGKEAFHWFVENRTVRKNDRAGEKVQRLPELLPKTGRARQTLEAMCCEVVNTGKFGTGGGSGKSGPRKEGSGNGSRKGHSYRKWY